MSITSYAQNFEDVMLWRMVKDATPGSYIDVGAQHPIIDSVSNFFYEKGWRGINIEPSQEYADLLRAHRPDEIVIQAAVSERPGVITFYQIPGGGLSTVRKDIAEKHQANLGCAIVENIVTAVTLDDLFALPLTGPVHWLKIDVEGFEREVLAGWRESNIRPWVVVIEATYPCTTIDTFEYWEGLILNKGYELVYIDGLNRYYLHHSQDTRRHIFKFPPNVFDEFQLSGTATSMTSALANRHQEELSRLHLHLEQSERQIQHLSAELEKLIEIQDLTNRAFENSITKSQELEKTTINEYLQIFRNDSRYFIEQLERLRAEEQLRITEGRVVYEAREMKLQSELAELRQRLEDQRVQGFGREEQMRQFAELQRQSQQSAATIEAEQLRAESARWQKDLLECERHFAEQLVKLRAEDQLRITELRRVDEAREMKLQSELAALRQRLEDHCVWTSIREDQLRLQAEKEQQSLQSSAAIEAEQLRAESVRWQKDLIECQRHFAEQFVKLRAEEQLCTNERRLDAARVEQLCTEAQTKLLSLSETVTQHYAYTELLAGESANLRNNWWWRMSASWRQVSKKRGSCLVPMENSMNKVRADIQRTAETTVFESAQPAISDPINTELTEVCSIETPQRSTLTKKVPTMYVENITELFALDGSAFIFETYRNLLHREPDKHGLAYYLGRLSIGYDKESVIAQIAKSDGCRPHKEIKGLQELVANEQRARHWLLGFFIRQSKKDRTRQAIPMMLYRIEKNLNLLRDTLHKQHQTLEDRHMFGEMPQNVRETQTYIPGEYAELSQMRTRVDSLLMKIKIRQPWTDSKLLDLDGEDFVDEIYRSVLHREPDSGGKSFFLSELQKGKSKLEILKHLIECDEAKDQPDNFVYLNTKLELLIAAIDGLWNRIVSSEKERLNA